MTDVKSGPLPPVFFLGGLLLQWGLHISLPIARLVPEAWAPLGTIPIVVGLGVVVVAALQFKKADTAIKPFDQPSALVTDGVFRVSRNPMYLAMIVIQIGAAMPRRRKTEGSRASLPFTTLTAHQKRKTFESLQPSRRLFDQKEEFRSFSSLYRQLNIEGIDIVLGVQQRRETLEGANPCWTSNHESSGGHQ